ncbi:MAG: PAS domain-containing protein [Candidatus Hydrogenedentes bacterium]|nr:PAS domain-containing protein [Candidatus Hydrogenedentota bacterium]
MSTSHQRILSAILGGSPGLLALQSKLLVYEVVNPQFSQFLGKSPAEVIGKTDAELFSEAESKLSAKEANSVLKSGMPRAVEQQLTGKDGPHWFDISRSPILDDNGDPAGILLTGYDITEFKTREVAVREVEARTAAVQQEIQSLQARVQAAERERDAAATRVQELEGLAAQQAEAARQLVEAQETARQLDASLSSARAAQDTAQARCAELEQELGAAREEAQRSSQASMTLEQEVHTLRKRQTEAAAFAEKLAQALRH